MALKTFNIDDAIYKEYSKHCKDNGISMSKQIEKFISDEIGKIVSGVVDVKRKVRKKVEKNILNDHPLSKYC